MLHLIPAVKSLKETGGTLAATALFVDKSTLTPRLLKALDKLPQSENGAPLTVTFGKGDGEGYTLTVTEGAVTITADSERGAFWAIQTLRQLFEGDAVPTVEIEDAPDFAYRGFYHDVTRGKVATVATLKDMIDKMAYYKMNALQLYVEHVFPFRETEALIEESSYLTPDELRELDTYCQERFIDFQPSLSTFGHLFELLEQPAYRHLRVLKDFEPTTCRWDDRMKHHTIDPRDPQSIEIVKSLIDQYMPSFSSEYFNVCCDETFDLKELDPEGKLYAEFVNKIIAHVTAKGKRVMMWADILLKHPNCITMLPEDTVFLNWNYRAEPPEENIKAFCELDRRQIVCPGTTTWNRFCERVEREEQNILKMAEYGYRYGAIGMLNTNWGDWGNPASLECSYYGMVLGAAKSWAIKTAADEAFYADVNALLYKNENAMRYLTAISTAHNDVSWTMVMRAAYLHKNGLPYETPVTADAVAAAQKTYLDVKAALAADEWAHEDFKAEFLLAAAGVCLLAELGAALAGIETTRLVNTEDFLTRYRAKWVGKNKESELSRMEEIFRYCDTVTVK